MWNTGEDNRLTVAWKSIWNVLAAKGIHLESPAPEMSQLDFLFVCTLFLMYNIDV